MKEKCQKNQRILVIDDSESIHEDFRTILGSSDANAANLHEAKSVIFGNASKPSKQISFEIDSAFQGQEGLEKVRQALHEGRPYAMAFVDIRMPPGWDGVETIKRIWKEYPELQVVICTAYSDYDWNDLIAKLGQTEQLLILKKPFDNVEVYQLASALTEKWYLSKQARLKHKELERIVEQRTHQVEEANKELTIALEEAKKAEKAKGEFLANMSHEIRTPMNAIIGFSDMLAEQDCAAEQKEYVNIIRDSAKNLLDLINDILDFSKIEAHQLDIEINECSLGRILSFIDSTMKPQVENKSLDFKIVESNGLPERIRTDPSRLRQCLINLTSNAVKFTEKGHVYVNVSLTNRNNQPYIRFFDLEDTGIGIPRDKQEAILRSFTQANGGTTRKYGGTGLGLTITKQLAELLGGELTLTSEEGKGSIFSLVIPAGLDVTKQPALDMCIDHIEPRKEKTGQSEFTGHILVAEDVKTNQMLIKLLLKQMGLEVTIAEDGSEAVQKALAQQFDLIFMDIQMPKMNGYEATRKLRNEGVKTPIIALTASAMSGDEGKCICAGFDDYLPKPLDRRKLLEKIRKYLPVENEALSEKANSVKSQVDELAELCCGGQIPQESSLKETIGIEDSKEILNWDELIGRLGDEELIEEVVPIFLKDNKERLDMLTKAVKAGDAKAIKLHAHAVKGAGRNIGAKRLSNVAHRLEYLGRENDMKAATPLFDELKTELEKVVTFLSRTDWIEIAKREKVITDEKL